MVKKLIPPLSNQKGFTLVEVMIALTLFALFITVFLMSQGANITMSVQMNEDVKLHNLAQRVMNEEILNPPKFTQALENDIKEKNFEEDGFKEYRYKIEYKKLEIPDFNQLIGKDKDSNNSSSSSSSGQNKTNAITQMVFKKLKKNIETMLWQLRITITNTQTDYSYALTTWVSNRNAKMDTNFGF